MAGIKIRHRSGAADGATAIGHELDTQTSLATNGAKIASFKNAGVEKLAVDKDGNLLSSGANSTWVVRPAEGSAGITAAISAASASGGGIVQLLAGTYIMTAPAVFPASNSAITLQGVGDATILDNQQTGGGPAIRVDNQSSGPYNARPLLATTRGATSITFNIASNASSYLADMTIVLEGADADGLYRGEVNEVLANGDGGTGVLTLKQPLQHSLNANAIATGYIKNRGRFSIKDFKVSHSSGAGGGVTFFTIGGYIENVHVDGEGFSDISAGLNVVAVGCTIRHCTVRNYNNTTVGDTQRGAIFFGHNIIVENCQFINSGNNAKANHAGVEFRNAFKCNFVNNKITNCNANGLRLWNAGAASEILIKGNSIVNNDGVGIYVIDDIQDPDVFITDNDILYNTSGGIVCSGRRAIISNNRCSFNDGYGIRSTGAEAIINGNECHGNLFDGIGVDGSKTAISGNRCSTNSLSGIALYSSNVACSISGNVTDSNTTRGIYLAGTTSGCAVVGNTSIGNTGAEIEIINAADNNLVSSNNCYGGTIVPGTGANNDLVNNKT